MVTGLRSPFAGNVQDGAPAKLLRRHSHGVASSVFRAMAIYRLIAGRSFGPDQIKAMVTAAYEAALVDLRLTDCTTPSPELSPAPSCTLRAKASAILLPSRTVL